MMRKRSTFGYMHQNPPSDAAKKMVSLDWKVYDDNDLSSGLHPFSVGYVSVEEANQQSHANHISDMMYSDDAAPSLADTQAVLSSTSQQHPHPCHDSSSPDHLATFLGPSLCPDRQSTQPCTGVRLVLRPVHAMRAGVGASPSPGPGASSHCACIVGAVGAASGLVLVPNPSAPKPNDGTTRLFGALQADRSERRMVPALSQSLHAAPSFVHARGCTC